MSIYLVKKNMLEINLKEELRTDITDSERNQWSIFISSKRLPAKALTHAEYLINLYDNRNDRVELKDSVVADFFYKKLKAAWYNTSVDVRWYVITKRPDMLVLLELL